MTEVVGDAYVPKAEFDTLKNEFFLLKHRFEELKKETKTDIDEIKTSLKEIEKNTKQMLDSYNAGRHLVNGIDAVFKWISRVGIGLLTIGTLIWYIYHGVLPDFHIYGAGG